jgi:parvulin-like peptidyl-prolyl isomerase
MRSLESACEELDVVRARILSGDTNFDQAARAVSDFKADVGGNLGWMSADDLAAWMVPALDSLAPGQMTPVLPMAFGCNLLMLVDRRSYKPTTFEDVRAKLEAELYDQKTGEEYAKWLEKLRSQTYIERKGAFAETTRLQSGR